MDLVLVQQENIAGAPAKAEVGARVVLGEGQAPRVPQSSAGWGQGTSLHTTEATAGRVLRGREHCPWQLVGTPGRKVAPRPEAP